MAFSTVQFQRVLATLRPVEIPARYCTWGGMAMNLLVILLGLALLGYLFSEI